MLLDGRGDMLGDFEGLTDGEIDLDRSTDGETLGDFNVGDGETLGDTFGDSDPLAGYDTLTLGDTLGDTNGEEET